MLLERESPALPSEMCAFAEGRLTRQQVYTLVCDEIGNAFRRAKARHDERVRSVKFIEGELVWFYCLKGKIGLSKKFMLRSKGPMKLIKRINLVNYILQDKPSTKPFVSHVDRMRKLYGESPVLAE